MAEPDSTADGPRGVETPSPERVPQRGPGAGRGSRGRGATGIGLGKIFGVGVRVDWSLLIIFALIVFELGAAVFPTWHPDWSLALVWTMAVATAVLFFASVLVHELSHALVARAQGIPVRRITLFLFGGLTQLEAEPATPKAEFWMAVVGPLVSIVIGLVATWAGAALIGEPLRLVVADGASDPDAIAAALAGANPLATLLLWLGPINLLLGLFNMVPGFPLDGGRVLRSILWAITKDLRKATRWAAFGGQLFAWVLMGLGVLDFFTGAWVSGLWLVLIGWFLTNAARTSYQQLLIRLALEDVPVSRVMRSSLIRVPPDLSVEAFLHEHALASDQQLFPVEDQVERPGRLLGVVGLAQLQELVRHRDRRDWARIRVDEVMVPASQLPSLPPDAGAERALTELSRREVDPLAVVADDKLLGLVRREDLMRWLSLHEWMQTADA